MFGTSSSASSSTRSITSTSSTTRLRRSSGFWAQHGLVARRCRTHPHPRRFAAGLASASPAVAHRRPRDDPAARRRRLAASRASNTSTSSRTKVRRLGDDLRATLADMKESGELDRRLWRRGQGHRASERLRDRSRDARLRRRSKPAQAGAIHAGGSRPDRRPPSISLRRCPTPASSWHGTSRTRSLPSRRRTGREAASSSFPCLAFGSCDGRYARGLRTAPTRWRVRRERRTAP